MKTSHLLLFAAAGLMGGLTGASTANAQGQASAPAPATVPASTQPQPQPQTQTRAQATQSTSASTVAPTATAATASPRPSPRSRFYSSFFARSRPAVRFEAYSRRSLRGPSAAALKAPPVPGLSSGVHRGAAGAVGSSPRLGALQERALKAPPVPLVATHHGRAAGGHRASSQTAGRGSFDEMFAKDPSGRHDLAGKSVGFYPSTRSLIATKTRAAAQKPRSLSERKVNANRALGVDK